MKESRALALAALLSLTALAGCGGGDSSQKAATAAHDRPDTLFGTSAAGPLLVHKIVLHCPQVAVLQQAQTLSTFLPGRSDVAAQVTTAQLTSFTGDCVLEKSKHALLLHIKPSFLADNGPANNGKPITLTWFAAITNGNSIVSKSNYNITLKFNGNTSTTTATGKPVKIEVPNVPDSEQLQILLGFEMTPDEQAYAAAHPNAAP